MFQQDTKVSEGLAASNFMTMEKSYDKNSHQNNFDSYLSNINTNLYDAQLEIYRFSLKPFTIKIVFL